MSWKPPERLNPELYKIFEKHRLGDRAILCLWKDGRFSDIREPSLELRDRLNEWLERY